ncbi:MAG: helix-turn-helix transcriptional regulator [Chloroflexi bacterium]|nr:helix-turn-helix transcriptional regulator [Chloroflexota bacterium]
MSTRMQVHRPVVFDLPDDFGERIEEFRVAAGLGVRSLARRLGVRPYRLREWRRGVAPASRHLFRLVTVAEAMGLSGILIRPDRDLPAGLDLDAPGSQ